LKLLVGLGNPGQKYAMNRHNIGFMAVDRIAFDHAFAPWRGKFQGQFAEGMLGREKVVLLKPTTFMNLSGQSVGEAMRFYKLDAADVTVFHDELDLAPGKLRAKTGGGMPGTMACVHYMPISARLITVSGWALGIRATKTALRHMFCRILPNPMQTGWMTYCAGYQTGHQCWQRVTRRGS